MTADVPELPGQVCLEDVLEGAPPAPAKARRPRLGPDSLRLEVPGIPVPQGSKKAFKHAHTNRVVMLDDNANLAAWRATVAHHARVAWAGAPPITGPVVASLGFYLPRPKGHYRTGKFAGFLKDSAPLLPGVKPDLDKLIRSVFDSLSTAGVWKDDALCWNVSAHKCYADAREPGLVLNLSWEAVNG